jgi:dephospho-CoA kinase
VGDWSDSLPFRVGLTGGIASGKSTVSAMFADLGVPVIDSDVIAREVVRPGKVALDEIRTRFGDAVFSEDGSLDRRQLRRVVFADDVSRSDLEAILHPRIQSEILRQSADAGGPYQLIVVPLLVGSQLLPLFDKVLVVDCDEQTQISRLIDRDSESIEHAKEILAAQSSRLQRLDIADDVVNTDGSIRDTNKRIIELDRQYRRLAHS